MNGTVHLRIAWLSMLFLMSAVSQAGVYQTGDNFVGFTAADQHGTAFTFKAGAARFILFETAGESGASNPPSDPKWFDNHRALLLVDISELGALKRRVAGSRMASKAFKILVVENSEAAARFPKQKEKFTVLLLDEAGKITDIRYAAAGKELQDLLSGGQAP